MVFGHWPVYPSQFWHKYDINNDSLKVNQSKTFDWKSFDHSSCLPSNEPELKTISWFFLQCLCVVRPRGPEHPLHGRVRRRKDGEHQESDSVPGLRGRLETQVFEPPPRLGKSLSCPCLVWTLWLVPVNEANSARWIMLGGITGISKWPSGLGRSGYSN